MPFRVHYQIYLCYQPHHKLEAGCLGTASCFKLEKLTPMAGKSWQLSHDPPPEGNRQYHRDKTVEKEGEGKNAKVSICSITTLKIPGIDDNICIRTLLLYFDSLYGFAKIQ